MRNWVFDWFYNFKKQISLKKWLYAVFILSALIPLILIGTISYFTIFSIQEENVDNAILSNLQQTKIDLEKTLDNIDYASKQLALDGKVGEKLERYQQTKKDNVFDKYELSKEIKDSINLIYYTNQYLGMMFYYFPKTGTTEFENLQVKDNFDINKLPLLTKYKGVSFYGPHKTAYTRSDNTVFSIARKLENYQDEGYIYIETNFSLLKMLLNTERQYGLEVSNILLNQNNYIIYSEKEEDFQQGTLFTYEKLKNRESSRGYYIFREISEKGWQIIAVISKADYNREVSKWFERLVLFGFFSLIASSILAFIVYEMVYRPLKILNKEIGFVSRSKFDSDIKLVNIREFDNILEHFANMRIKILELLDEVEKKEKLKRRIEVEKLLHQINPHFLHNTLNTIQWIARMNGQVQIDRSLAQLTKILHYNLGKEGSISTVRHEVEALQAYIDLQRLRYDEKLDIKINADSDALTLQIPRFIMQPLVENAIYHGLKGEEGKISVDVELKTDEIHVSVKDNGIGLDAKEIQRLLSEEAGKGQDAGMGIGLSYVDRMLKVHYGEKAKLNISSTKGQGTLFNMRMPRSIS